MKDSPEKLLFARVKEFLNSRNILSAIFFSAFILLLFIFINYKLLPKPNPFINQQVIIGQIAVIIVLSLTVTYFYAFRFFNDSIYLFISSGWFANASYLLFEFFFNDQCFNASSSFCQEHSDNNFCKDDNGTCLKYSIAVYLFSLLSTVAFYIASTRKLKKDEKPLNKTSFFSRLLIVLSKIPLIIWLVLASIPALIVYFLPTDPNDFIDYKFRSATVCGMLFTAFCLFYLGYKFQIFFNEEYRSDSENKKPLILAIFPWTFYIYGLMQFSYPLKIYLMQLPGFPLDLFFITIKLTVLKILFIIASILKLLNVWGLMSWLLQVKYHDYMKTRDEYLETKSALDFANLKLSQSSHLATLGAISASIEHDLKTPLSVLRTEILAMRKVFQNNSKLIPYLSKLENQSRRISAIAKIIPFIRASNEFYNTEKFMNKVSVTEIVNLAIRSVKKELSLDTEKYFFVNKNKDYFVRAYPEMIEQIFTNLFKNSIEAIEETGKNGGAVDIHIRLEKELPDDIKKDNPNAKEYSKWVRVDVNDKGCGIAPENIPNLTSLYTSKGENKPNGGIGLFIANLILEFHDAVICFQSKVGAGTTVSIFFPEWDAYWEHNENKHIQQNSQQNVIDETDLDEINEKTLSENVIN